MHVIHKTYASNHQVNYESIIRKVMVKLNSEIYKLQGDSLTNTTLLKPAAG